MPKHISIPLVNQDKLNKLVLKHKNKLANMELYEHIAKTGAVSGEGLLQLEMSCHILLNYRNAQNYNTTR